MAITTTDPRYITVDKVIRESLFMEGQDTTHDYQRAYQIALNGARNVTSDIYGPTQIATLNVGSNARAAMPVNYLEMTRLAILRYTDNELSPLRPNDEIPLTDDLFIKNSFTNDQDNVVEGQYYRYLFGYDYKHYGVGGGQNRNGDYRIDHSTSEFVFNAELSNSPVILEYIATELRNEDGAVIVHIDTKDALLAYINWRVSIWKDRRNLNAISFWKREWHNESNRARARVQSFTLDEAYNTVRRQNTQTPKF